MVILLECAVVLSVGYVIFSYANKWVALFLVLAAFSQFFPFYGRSSYVAFHVVFYGCILYGLIVVYGDESTAKIMMDMMCIVAIANVGLQFLQLVKMDPIYLAVDGGHSLTTGFMTNVNGASALMAFCFPAFMRRFWLWFIPMIVFGFICAHSSGGVVATVIGVCLYGLLAEKWWISVTILICYAFYWKEIDAPNVSGVRLNVTMVGWEAFKEHWIFGYGIGHWKMVFLKKGLLPSYFAQAHNEYIQGLMEMGIGFAVVLGGYLINIARRIKDDSRLHLPIIAMVIIIINSSVNFSFHVAPTAAMAIIWMAILEIELRQTKQRSIENA